MRCSPKFHTNVSEGPNYAKGTGSLMKCKVTHIGRNNLHSSHSFPGSKLTVATQEKDLGVTLGSQ